MKKLLALLFLVTSFPVFAQKPVNLSTSKNGTPIYHSAGSGANVGLGLSFTVDSATTRIDTHNSVPNQPFNTMVYLEGSKKISLFGWVNKDSVDFYRYNVTENDNHQIVEDAKPLSTNVHTYINNKAQIALGTCLVANKKLTINLYKITARSKISTTIIYNKDIAPAKIFIIALNKQQKGRSYVEMITKLDSTKFRADKITKSMAIVLNRTDLDFVYTAYLKNKETGKVLYRSNNWLYEYFNPGFPYLFIDAAYFKKPGDYEIEIIPTLSNGFRSKTFPDKTTRYSFTIEEEKVDFFSLEGLSIYMVLFGVLSGALSVYLLRVYKKKTAEKLAIQKIKLDSIRSQLNPHFLFNALAGIQNLMNKQEVENANRYLTKFARLTRNVLESKELISIAEEKMLLNDYLQMEQLRFHFNYQLEVSEAIDSDNIEIPSMLLQPFVENAVKHGIAGKGNEGHIEVYITLAEKDLILKVKDNGMGYDSSRNYAGLGLQLSKNRISLLNTIYKENPFILDVQSRDNGTEVTITLTQWL
ncbi:histidine kinase [Pedobacter steynii]|nr:histidine kinase [Pedobacter steynii]NQX41330.1 histidine kinase [Pedobacter steynii]